MTIRIIDNKRIDLTDDEWDMYRKIVKSYTEGPNKGEDLFKDLFETDGGGNIIFLKPPSKYRTSFEVFLFLMSIFQHQHLRLMHREVTDICTQMKAKMQELEDKISQKS
jgi:hypothetical protein